MKRLITLLLFALGSVAFAADRPPNIVLILIDDMGYGDIGPFGNTVNQTPHLDRMAAEGNVLRQFYVSNTACTPSRAALLTGTYAHRIGMDKSVVFPGEARGLNPDEITLAEMLKDVGYTTGIFGKWHLGDQPEFLPLAQGFDEYFGIPYSNDMWPGNGRGNPVTNRGPYEPLPIMRGNEAVAYVADGSDQALLCEVVTDEAVKFIEAHQDKPFFCFVPHAYIHNPRFARAEIMERAEGDSRRANIEEVDDSVGRILDAITKLGIAESTLVMFTSDNGGAEVGPLRGKKIDKKYEGHMREPTLTWWPGTIPAGIDTEAIATSVDLLPSLARLTGATVPTDRIIDGKDSLDILLGNSDAVSAHDILYYETGGIRRGDWKLVRYAVKGETINELYHLGEDLGERNNLADKNPTIVKELGDLLTAHNERIEANQRTPGFKEGAGPILTETGDLPKLRELIGKPGVVAVNLPSTSAKPPAKPNRPGQVSHPTGGIRSNAIDIKPDPTAIVIADFEGVDYGEWKAEGDAFGSGPVSQTTSRNRLQGFIGNGIANSFQPNDSTEGTLTSPEFAIARKHLNFLIGGGNRPREVGIRLLIDGKEVRRATGFSRKNNKREEVLAWSSWDVSEFIGEQATIELFDHFTKGWGHIQVDHIVQSDRDWTDSPPKTIPSAPQAPAPQPVEFSEADWTTFPSYLEVGYDQPLRPQFHFTSRKNWLNDPNGMVYYDGEWLMCFQHVVNANNTGPKSWGAAVSPDLMHWKQLPHAINPYPNVMGREGLHTIWSGSAVVDVHNALGKQVGDTKTLFALYTATDPVGFFQGAAYSTDRGRTWTKINEGKPVIPHQEGFSKGQRDPRIVYFEPDDCYITIMMIGGPERKVRLWKSTDLLTWEPFLDIPNKAAECIDLYSVAVDGDPKNRKWVIADANTHYEVGEFDGKTWTGLGAEDAAGKRHRFDYGDAWYAAQAFNQGPDGRVVHIGWLRSKQAGFRPFLEAGMPFTQQMSVPIEITLRTTLDGIRLVRNPVKEIEGLYEKTTALENLTGKEANAKLADHACELVDLSLRCEAAEDFTLSVRGLEIHYESETEEFVFTNTARVEGEKAAWKKKGPYRGTGVRRIPAPGIDGQVTLRALVDRVSLELFINDGQAAASFVVVPSPEETSIRIKNNDSLLVHSLVINELNSIWQSLPSHGRPGPGGYTFTSQPLR
ncbi:MAG: sulfatase-like hydrolase/transferase [Verrucomicrobiota bacterium]